MSKFIFTVNIEVTTLESAEFRRNMTSIHNVSICRTWACMFQLLHSSACVAQSSAIKTLFWYNLKENIQIYHLIKQYSKHEKIWRQNVLLQQKVMLISHEVIERARQETNRQKRQHQKTCM